MSQTDEVRAAVEPILDRHLAAYQRRLDIQQTPAGWQVNEVLPDGSLRPLADTTSQEEVICLASSATDIVALISTVAALTLRLSVERGPEPPSIAALAAGAPEPLALRVAWTDVDWQATDPPFDDVTSFATPRIHRRVMARWRRTGEAPPGYAQCARPDQGTLPPEAWGYRLEQVDWTGFEEGDQGR